MGTPSALSGRVSADFRADMLRSLRLLLFVTGVCKCCNLVEGRGVAVGGVHVQRGRIDVDRVPRLRDVVEKQRLVSVSRARLPLPGGGADAAAFLLR